MKKNKEEQWNFFSRFNATHFFLLFHFVSFFLCSFPFLFVNLLLLTKLFIIFVKTYKYNNKADVEIFIFII